MQVGRATDLEALGFTGPSDKGYALAAESKDILDMHPLQEAAVLRKVLAEGAVQVVT